MYACLTTGMAKKKENPLSHLYAIFNRQKSQVFTDRQSASVDEIYSIADSTTADHGVDNAAFNETIHSSGTRHVTYDNNYVTQEIGGHKTAMKPLTKPMPAIERKDNCQNLSGKNILLFVITYTQSERYTPTNTRKRL